MSPPPASPAPPPPPMTSTLGCISRVVTQPPLPRAPSTLSAATHISAAATGPRGTLPTTVTAYDGPAAARLPIPVIASTVPPTSTAAHTPTLSASLSRAFTV